MIWYLRDHLGTASFTLALALVLPGAVQAGSLSFRNDTAGPVIVQAMSVVQSRVVAGTRHVLQPGASSKDLVVRPGNKLIIIVDAKRPTQTLYMDVIPFAAAGLNKFYSIQPDAPAGNAKPAKPPAPPRVKLVEMQIPANPAPGTAPGTPRR
jgi:hypothetical protein